MSALLNQIEYAVLLIISLKHSKSGENKEYNLDISRGKGMTGIFSQISWTCFTLIGVKYSWIQLGEGGCGVGNLGHIFFGYLVHWKQKLPHLELAGMFF